MSSGSDLKGRLNNQVAACQAFLTVIGPSWLDAKDETARPRINRPDDFIAVEIATALAHNIPVIPVLVDGARMPSVSELPEFLKPLARCQAVEVRRLDFDRDAEALVERIRGALSNKAIGHTGWRVRMLASATAVAVILIGIGSYTLVQHILVQRVQQAKLKGRKRAGPRGGANRKVEEAEKQRLAAAQEERQARATAEAEAKRKSEEAEQQRITALRAAEEERNRAEAEARARYTALISQGDRDSDLGDYDRAVAEYNEAIRS